MPKDTLVFISPRVSLVSIGAMICRNRVLLTWIRHTLSEVLTRSNCSAGAGYSVWARDQHEQANTPRARGEHHVRVHGCTWSACNKLHGGGPRQHITVCFASVRSTRNPPSKALLGTKPASTSLVRLSAATHIGQILHSNLLFITRGTLSWHILLTRSTQGGCVPASTTRSRSFHQQRHKLSHLAARPHWLIRMACHTTTRIRSPSRRASHSAWTLCRSSYLCCMTSMCPQAARPWVPRPARDR